MRRTAIFVGFTALFAITTLGCQSHHATVEGLQKKYDQLSQQFGKDCSAEYLKVPPTLSPKCNDENQRMKEVWDQLQAERARK